MSPIHAPGPSLASLSLGGHARSSAAGASTPAPLGPSLAPRQEFSGALEKATMPAESARVHPPSGRAHQTSESDQTGSRASEPETNEPAPSDSIVRTSSGESDGPEPNATATSANRERVEERPEDLETSPARDDGSESVAVVTTESAPVAPEGAAPEPGREREIEPNINGETGSLQPGAARDIPVGIPQSDRTVASDERPGTGAERRGTGAGARSGESVRAESAQSALRAGATSAESSADESGQGAPGDQSEHEPPSDQAPRRGADFVPSASHRDSRSVQFEADARPLDSSSEQADGQAEHRSARVSPGAGHSLAAIQHEPNPQPRPASTGLDRAAPNSPTIDESAGAAPQQSTGVSASGGASTIESTLFRLVDSPGAGLKAQYTSDGLLSQQADPAPGGRLVAQAVSRGLSAALHQQGGIVTLKLAPPSLGTVRVEMTMDRGAVTVSLETTTAAARAMLADQLDVLRGSLESRGLSVEKLAVRQSNLASHPAGTSSGSQHSAAGEQQFTDQRQEHDAGRQQSRGSYSGHQDGEGRQRSQEEQASEEHRELSDAMSRGRFEHNVRVALEAVA